MVLSLEAPERTEADRFYKAKDLDGLRVLARPSNDSYVRARLARLLADLGLEDELLRLAVISNRAARTVAELFASQGRIDDLLRHIVCGNGFANRVLADCSITGLTDEDHARILSRGLTPNGTPA